MKTAYLRLCLSLALFTASLLSSFAISLNEKQTVLSQRATTGTATGYVYTWLKAPSGKTYYDTTYMPGYATSDGSSSKEIPIDETGTWTRYVSSANVGTPAKADGVDSWSTFDVVEATTPGDQPQTITLSPMNTTVTLNDSGWVDVPFTASDGHNAYTWSGDVSGASGATPTVRFTSTGIKSVTVWNEAGKAADGITYAQSNTKTAIVTVKAYTITGLTLPTITIQSATLTSPSPSASISASPSSGAGSSSSPFSTSISWASNNASSFSVTKDGSNWASSGSSKSDSLGAGTYTYAITAQPTYLATISWSATNTTNNVADITVSGPGTTTVTSTTTATVSAPGTYTVTGKGTDGSSVSASATAPAAPASATASTTVTVTDSSKSDQYLAFINPTSATVTQGDSLTFTASGGTSTGSYIWGGDATGSGTTNTVTFNTIGTRTVSVYKAGDSNYNVSNTATATITVIDPNSLIPAVWTASPTTFYYDGSSQGPTEITGTPTVAGYSQNYTVSGTTRATAIGDYSFTVTGKGKYAGSSNSISWKILKQALEIYISPVNPTIMSGSSVTFYANGPSDWTPNYVWTGKAAGTGDNKTVNFPTAGTYTVTVQGNASGNYSFSAKSIATATITVLSTQIPITIQAGSAAKYFDDTELIIPAPTLVGGMLASGHTFKPTNSSPARVGPDAGTYDISASPGWPWNMVVDASGNDVSSCYAYTVLHGTGTIIGVQPSTIDLSVSPTTAQAPGAATLTWTSTYTPWATITGTGPSGWTWTSGKINYASGNSPAGTKSFSGLAAGTYTFTMTADGYDWATGRVTKTKTCTLTVTALTTIQSLVPVVSNYTVSDASSPANGKTYKRVWQEGTTWKAYLGRSGLRFQATGMGGSSAVQSFELQSQEPGTATWTTLATATPASGASNGSGISVTGDFSVMLDSQTPGSPLVPLSYSLKNPKVGIWNFRARLQDVGGVWSSYTTPVPVSLELPIAVVSETLQTLPPAGPEGAWFTPSKPKTFHLPVWIP